MDFYYLVCEQGDGWKFNVAFSLTNSEAAIQEMYNKYRKDLYKSLEIKKVSMSQEDVLMLLIMYSGNGIMQSIMSDPNK